MAMARAGAHKIIITDYQPNDFEVGKAIQEEAIENKKKNDIWNGYIEKKINAFHPELVSLIRTVTMPTDSLKKGEAQKAEAQKIAARKACPKLLEDWVDWVERATSYVKYKFCNINDGYMVLAGSSVKKEREKGLVGEGKSIQRIHYLERQYQLIDWAKTSLEGLGIIKKEECRASQPQGESQSQSQSLNQTHTPVTDSSGDPVNHVSGQESLGEDMSDENSIEADRSARTGDDQEPDQESVQEEDDEVCCWCCLFPSSNKTARRDSVAEEEDESPRYVRGR